MCVSCFGVINIIIIEMEPWTAGPAVYRECRGVACVRMGAGWVSVVDVRVFCACARGERLLGVINIIIYPLVGRGLRLTSGLPPLAHSVHTRRLHE